MSPREFPVSTFSVLRLLVHATAFSLLWGFWGQKDQNQVLMLECKQFINRTVSESFKEIAIL